MVRQAISITPSGIIWSGSVLLDSSFTEDGSPVYLRYFRFGVNPRIRFSPAADTPSPSTADAELRTEWETGDEAIEFEASNGDTFTLRGPAHSSNSFADDIEPYFWATDEGSGLVAFYNNHVDETLTLYLESGIDITSDGPWSVPLGLLTEDGLWSAILGGLESTDGPWSDLVSRVTTDGPWSVPLGRLTEDGPWSGFVSTATSDGPWSELLSTTIDGPWSVPLVVNETLDGPWSDVLGGLESTDGPWSDPRRAYVTVQTGVLVLNTPMIPEGEDVFTEDSPGNYSVDIQWDGKPEHDALHQVRIRWIAREDTTAGPAPDHFTAGQWDDLDGDFLELQNGFEYRDTIISDPDMASSGMVTLTDQMLEQMDWAGRTVWVFARLEVADGSKLNKVAAGTG